ncbi:MAG: carbohydrate kinase [Symbiobacteriaceae bacterium]|jgi:xylulokinase|nr:carbohydrate kinase [Symbiobacteriaceae bacterium]
MSYLIGVDVGTTNLKVMAFDHNGLVAASAVVKTPILRPGPKMFEHDPDAIWEQVTLGIRQVVDTLGAAEIDAIAIASVAEEGFLLDSSGKALAPAIAWYDQRTAPQAARWANTFGSWETYRISGLLADSIYSLYKIQWIQGRQPDLYEQATKWLCMADYVTYRLSGEQAMTYSLASHTMALDLERREWSDEILKAARISRRLLPDLVESGTLIGRVTSEAAAVTGLAEGTPVVTGGHDHICGALAAGVLAPGSVLDSTGTAEALLVGLDRPAMSPTTFAAHIHFGAHTARGRYYAGTAMTAGPVVDWVRDRMLGTAENGADSYQALSEEALTSPPGARGLFFLPLLSDVGFTDRDGWSRGAMLGLQLSHTRGDIFRAAFEGLTYELRARLELLEDSLALGRQPRTVVSGGAARNPLQLQLKASILERTVSVPAATETTALGAALLAGLGVGIYKDEADAIARTTHEAVRVVPEAEQIPTYRTLYQTYCRLFDQTADTWHRWPWGPDGIL